MAGSASTHPAADARRMSNTTHPALEHIQALIDAGGQIMIGTVRPIVAAAARPRAVDRGALP